MSNLYEKIMDIVAAADSEWSRSVRSSLKNDLWGWPSSGHPNSLFAAERYTKKAIWQAHVEIDELIRNNRYSIEVLTSPYEYIRNTAEWYRRLDTKEK